MKKFTCKEMGGSCEESFEGETFKEVGEKGGMHIMNSTDEDHGEIRKEMANSSEEDVKKWWDWFSMEWDKKDEV